MTILSPGAVNNTPEIFGATPTAQQLADRERVYAMPLDKIDPAELTAYPDESMFWKFERLRAEQPVHYTADEDSNYGAYWSITK